MVAPNRDLRNKQFLSSAFTFSTIQMASLPSIVVMDVNKVNNFDNVRRRSPSSSKVSFRSTSIFSNISSILHHERMIINNNLPDEEFKEPVDVLQR